MLAILRINVSYDPEPVTVLAYAAFDHVADAQFFPIRRISTALPAVNEEVRAATTKSGKRERRNDVPAPVTQ
jgi:hypothetical protein